MLFPLIIVVVVGLFFVGRYAWERNRVLGIVVYVLLGIVVAWLIGMYFVLDRAGWMDH